MISPIANTRKATGNASIEPIPTLGETIKRTPKIKIKVPIISEMRLFEYDLIAGLVQNAASLRSLLSVSEKCCL